MGLDGDPEFRGWGDAERDRVPRPRRRPAGLVVGHSGAMQPAMEPENGSVIDHRREGARARPTAREGPADPAGTVRCTALGALDRLGGLTDHDLVRAIGDPAPEVRRRACELAATRQGGDLIGAPAASDAGVAEMAAWAAGEQGAQAAVPALVRMSSAGTGHADPLCREAAVA